MEVGPVHVVLDVETTILIVAFTLAGSSLGVISGLIPGLHANNFAMLLVGLAPSVPAPPLYVGVAMLAAGVVHSFVDAVPALAIGVPDADMAVMALPGHRLVLEGRGREALRLSALGSVLAVILAVPLAIPLTLGMLLVYEHLMDHVDLILATVVVGLIVTEPSPRAAVGGVLSFSLATALGVHTLDRNPTAPLDVGGFLSPIFAGLFGAPVLVDAAKGSGVPPQETPSMRTSRRLILLTAAGGTISGAIVGFLPGISAAIAAVAVLAGLPAGGGDRGYVVATSGVDTSNTIFALFALAALGAPRSGIVVAYEELGAPVELIILVLATVMAGCLGYLVVVTIGDRYLELIGEIDYTKLSVGLLVGLTGLSFLFAGPLGILVFGVSAIIGLVPVRIGGRRVHLMGVLIGPMLLS